MAATVLAVFLTPASPAADAAAQTTTPTGPVYGRAADQGARALPAAAARVRPRPAIYGGSTSMGDPVFLELSRERGSMTRVGRQWRAPCASGMGYATAGELRKGMTVEDDGTFRLVSQTTYQLIGGLSGRETEELWGTLQGGSVLAAWHAHVDVVDRASGAEIDDCDIRFGARATAAKGRVFGGLTSQGAPIVVQLSDDARSVSTFRIGWRAECAQLGFIPLGSTLRNLPMTRGRFGGGVSETRRTPGGGTVAIRLSPNGRVGGVSASGGFQGSVAQSDASGALRRRCRSGRVSWNAMSG